MVFVFVFRNMLIEMGFAYAAAFSYLATSVGGMIRVGALVDDAGPLPLWPHRLRHAFLLL